ncbi:MAG: hypothetical protein EP340_06470 [Alphaproteobacteria bacterium]|nr:MAG: hypothetical protein EP340_06470 [Alphaproteobacteria bacterium]
MRKLLGFLLLIVLIAAGGAYYYLTFVFPEREVVANMERTAAYMGAEFSYSEIEPGPLGLTGRIVKPKFTFPGAAEGETAAAKDEDISFDEISYELDPVWMLQNIQTIYQLRAITHYKSLALVGFELKESEDEFAKLESLTLEEVDYTGFATKLQEDPSFTPDPESFESLDDVRELFWAEGLALDGLKFKSDETTMVIDHEAIRGISESGIGLFELENFSMATPEVVMSINSIEIENLNVPLTPEALKQNPFSTADRFEINEIQVTAAGVGKFAVEQIYIRENEHAVLSGGMKVPTNTESGIIGISFPTMVFASSPEAFTFFATNQMETLVIDLTSKGNLDIDTGLGNSNMTLKVHDMASLSFGLDTTGATRAMFEEVAEFIQTSMAADEETVELTLSEIADFIKALTDPILNGTSPENYQLPDLPNLEKAMEELMAGSIADLAVAGGSLAYEDLSLVDKITNFMMAQGMSEADAKTMLSQSLVMAAVSTVGTPVAEEVTMGLYAMTLDPGSFTVDIELAPPVSVGEVMSLSQDKEAMNAFLMTDWNARVQSTLKVYDGEGNEVDTDTLQ